MLYDSYYDRGESTVFSGNCPSPHKIHLESNDTCAWSEGWATFVAHAVDGEPKKIWTKGTSVDLETHALVNSNNQRYLVFADVDGFLGPKIGQITEGRVAAALWPPIL